MNKHIFIMDMMRKFKLCFHYEVFPDHKFLIPDLIPNKEPYTGEWNDALAFQYHYDVLPGSIISQFILRMHPFICENTYWHNGVVLEDNDKRNKALVKADREDRKIFIWVIGVEQTRRAFLGTIRSNFYHIHQTILRTKPDEKVPLPDHIGMVGDYKHLLTLEESGEASYIPEGLRERYSLKQLLDGFEPDEERRERAEGDGRGGKSQVPRQTPPYQQVIIKDTPTTPIGKQRKSVFWELTPLMTIILLLLVIAIISKQTDRWILTTLYLLAETVAIVTLIAVISKHVPWHTLPVVIFGAILFIALIGALQLMQEGMLSQDNFLTFMCEIFKQLPLLNR